MELDYKSTVVCGGDEKSLDFWNISTGKLCLTIPDAHSQPIYDIATTSMREIASCSGDKTIKIWNLKKPQKPRLVLEGHTDEIFRLDYLPSSSNLVSCGKDKTLRLWNLMTRSTSVISREDTPLRGLVNLGSGIISCGSEGGLIKIWDILSKKAISTIYNEIGVFSLDFSPEYKLLISGSCEMNTRRQMTSGVVKFWDIRSKNKLVKQVIIDVKVYNTATLNIRVNKNRLIVANSGNHIDIIDLSSLKSVFRWRTNKIGAPGRNAIANITTSTFISCPSDNKIKYWDFQGNLLGKELGQENNYRVHAVKYLGLYHVSEIVQVSDKEYKDYFKCDLNRWISLNEQSREREWNHKLSRVKKIISNESAKDLKILLKGSIISLSSPSKKTSNDSPMKFKVKKVKLFKSFFFGTPLWPYVKNESMYKVDFPSSSHTSTNQNEGGLNTLTSHDHNMILMIFFGYDNILKTENDFLKMFMFFDLIQQYRIVYIILKKLEQINDLEFLIRLFYQSFLIFEKPSVDEQSSKDNVFDDDSLDESTKLDGNSLFVSPNKFHFQSVLSIQLFNIFRTKFFMKIRSSSSSATGSNNQIPSNKYVQVFEKLNLLSYLLEYEVYDISRFNQFQSFGLNVNFTPSAEGQSSQEKEPNTYYHSLLLSQNSEYIKNSMTFLSVYEDQRDLVFGRRRDVTCNLLIKTNDNLTIRVCREFLCVESDFFTQIIDEYDFSDERNDEESDEEDDGEEKMDVLVLERLNFESLMIYLNFLFNGEREDKQKQEINLEKPKVRKIPHLDQHNITSAFFLLSEIEKCHLRGSNSVRSYSSSGDSVFLLELIEEIRRVSVKLIDSKTFKQVFVKIGYLFDKRTQFLKNETKSYFLTFWGNEFYSATKLIRFISQSCEKRRILIENDFLKDEMKKFEKGENEEKEKVLSIKEKLSLSQNENKKLKGKIRKLENIVSKKNENLATVQMKASHFEEETKKQQKEIERLNKELLEMTELYEKVPKLFRKKKKKSSKDL